MTFLGYPDGRLTPSIEFRRDISREIRRVRPDRVVCQSPERMWDRLYREPSGPPGQRARRRCARSTPMHATPSPTPSSSRRDSSPSRSPSSGWWRSPDPNRAVDVTTTFDRKIEALRCHRSQVGEGDRAPGRIRSWLEPAGRAAGLPEGGLAETFRVVDTG